MEVEGKINQGEMVGEMKVGGMVQVKDENEQNVMCVRRGSNVWGAGGKDGGERDC